jgi:hypothetical protein
MNENAGMRLFEEFVNEPVIANRLRITNALAPVDRLDVLFTGLSWATDAFQALAEIATSECDLESDFIMRELQRKLQIRSADYSDHLFNEIVTRLGDPGPT